MRKLRSLKGRHHNNLTKIPLSGDLASPKWGFLLVPGWSVVKAKLMRHCDVRRSTWP
jgi:hypothetical protein